MSLYIITNAAKALGAALLAALVLLLAVNAVALRAADPDSLAGALGIAVFITAACAGGGAAARFGGESPLACSAAFVGLYLLVHFIARLIVGDAGSDTAALLLCYAGAAAGALLSGYILRPRHGKSTKGIRRFKKYARASRR